MIFSCRALQVTRKVDILTPLGALYYNTGRYEEALQVYREAVALQPDSTDIWLALVSTYTQTLTELCNARTYEYVSVWVAKSATSWILTKNGMCLALNTLPKPDELFILFDIHACTQSHTVCFFARLRFYPWPVVLKRQRR